MQPSMNKSTHVAARASSFSVFRIGLIVAVMLVISVLAFWQRSVASATPYKEHYRIGSLQWFFSPIDLTPQRRLPVVRSELHDVAAWNDTVFVVGSGGLILRSFDGGTTWNDTVVSFPYKEIRETLPGKPKQ